MDNSDDITWGKDGYDRCFLCYRYEREVIFCGLPGVPGKELVFLYLDYG